MPLVIFGQAWKHSWVRSFSITPGGEEKIVADRIHALLTNPPKRDGTAH